MSHYRRLRSLMPFSPRAGTTPLAAAVVLRRWRRYSAITTPSASPPRHALREPGTCSSRLLPFSHQTFLPSPLLRGVSKSTRPLLALPGARVPFERPRCEIPSGPSKSRPPDSVPILRGGRDPHGPHLLSTVALSRVHHLHSRTCSRGQKRGLVAAAGVPGSPQAREQVRRSPPTTTPQR
jgi:hypothetical protein